MKEIKGKRKTQSAILISEALMELMENNEYNEIPISKICEHATVSRNTFYRLFDDKEDVLEYALKIRTNEIIQRYVDSAVYDLLNPSYSDILSAYEHFYLFWYNERHLLILLYKCGKLNEKFNLMKTYFYNSVSEHIIVTYKKNENFHEYYYDWLSGAITGIMRKWTERNFTDPPQELAEITMQLFRTTSYKFYAE